MRTLGPPPEDPAGDAEAHARATAYLDGSDVAYAVLNPGIAGALSAASSDQLIECLARATNDWLVGEWLESDERFLGSIVVSAYNPALAAAEIRRLGGEPRMVQVLVAHPGRLLGARPLRPLFDAAAEHGLVVNLQAGGAWTGGNRGVFATGFPSSPYEEQLSWECAAQPHLVSAVASGLFEDYPDLRLVLSGFGAAWLPPLLWRMDLEFESGRVGLPPALERRPSELVRRHVRLTTQPLEVPPDAAPLADLLASVDGERLLLHASGAPLWRDSAVGPRPLEALPEAWRQQVLLENARETYRLDIAAAAGNGQLG